MYYKNGTNRSTKVARDLYKENWERFEEITNNLKLGFDTKLELAKEYIGEINNQQMADEQLLKSMRRSFSSRIGRQRRLAKLEGNLPKWEKSDYII